MEGQDIRGLIEAYSQVYETPEDLSEEVVEEDVEQLDEYAGGGNRGPTAQDLINKRQATLKRTGGVFGAGGGQAKLKALQAKGVDGKSAYAQVYSQGEKNLSAKPKPAAAAKPAAPAAAAKPAAKPAAPAAAAKPTAPAAAAKPAATAASKPAPAPAKPSAAPAAAKPAATAAAKPAGSAMDQWAKANPKLAAAKAERDRTRGTSATTNPLMKDMKSSLPAPKTPAPSTATTGFNLAKKGVNLAAGVDIFDLVKGHLLDEGYAETEENAIVMMANMSEEWRKSILEAHGIELDEAQRARENPEGHDKEEKKKYEPVRGEKTPMPPRGDKRREDFEKWYAKHVR